MVNENLNYMSTVTKPTIQVYRNEDYPGCLIYEVNYEQIFPIYSRQPSSYYYSSFFSYHNVEFIDFYTGTVIPSVYLSTSIDSFGVTCKFRLNSTPIPVERYAIPLLSVKQSKTACQIGMLFRFTRHGVTP